MRLEGDDGVHDDEVDEVTFVRKAKAKKLLHSRSDRAVLRLATQALEKR